MKNGANMNFFNYHNYDCSFECMKFDKIISFNHLD